MLRLRLRALDNEKVVGIYTKGRLPERMRFLHPEAAASFVNFIPGVTVSDMFRSPEASLAAVRAKRGAMPPGWSGHNYGLSIDLDVKATMKILLLTKRDLDEWMESHGWYCHRRDHKLAFESWHYNFLGPGTVISPKVHSTSGYIEAKIQRLYGSMLVENMTDKKLVQIQLKKLHLYNGEIDGSFGPLSKESLKAFQRTWGLQPNGVMSTKTGRTLAYVSCERVLA
jgi:hypothetical protein